MQQGLIDTDGGCRASIQEADDCLAIRAELLDANRWIEPTHRWLEIMKDPTRFRLIFLLHEHRRLCVCDLANVLCVSSSAVSQHLRRLKNLCLVQARREKQTLFYYLCDPAFVEFFDKVIRAGGAPGKELRVDAEPRLRARERIAR